MSTVAFARLGIGIGKVSADQSALQVCQAIKEVCFDEFRFPNPWAEAQVRHQKMHTQQFRDLQLSGKRLALLITSDLA